MSALRLSLLSSWVHANISHVCKCVVPFNIISAVVDFV